MATYDNHPIWRRFFTVLRVIFWGPIWFFTGLLIHLLTISLYIVVFTVGSVITFAAVLYSIGAFFTIRADNYNLQGWIVDRAKDISSTIEAFSSGGIFRTVKDSIPNIQETLAHPITYFNQFGLSDDTAAALTVVCALPSLFFAYSLIVDYSKTAPEVEGSLVMRWIEDRF